MELGGESVGELESVNWRRRGGRTWGLIKLQVMNTTKTSVSRVAP